jgi:murein DD-endopeptidase MepM/ murein hydrolase activator NlpD
MIRALTLLAALSTLVPTLTAQPIDLRLPTENHHLFSSEPERFYMYVDRTFEGETSKPWEGGAFGYVRTPIRVNGEVLMTKFHEGIDIAPIKRDRSGDPLDLICSIADGTVVHISPISGRSNYGKYLVVAHRWDDSTVYSLYAHLAEITCQPGDTVKAGSVLGRMGYTGVGLNRTRAHLHLEIAFLMSENYDEWQKTYVGGINHHGKFNGMNLSGVDVAGFFLAHRKNPNLKFSEFIASTQVYFKVSVPAKDGRMPDFARRHPWMVTTSTGEIRSWDISFSATGHPIAFASSAREVAAPVIAQVRPTPHNHRHLTRGLVTGTDNQASLTAGGKQLVALVTDDFPLRVGSDAR